MGRGVGLNWLLSLVPEPLRVPFYPCLLDHGKVRRAPRTSTLLFEEDQSCQRLCPYPATSISLPLRQPSQANSLHKLRI